MTGSECQATQAAATEVEAALDAYERHVRRLVRTWLDMDLYRTVSAEIDDLRSCCAALPQLSTCWVALLISHADLVHCLWRSSQAGERVSREELQHRLEEHLDCIHALADRSHQLAERG
ncbi:MAG: hypothetical protein EOO30_20075 [Comamonadaceae bacterium]|nr:MAG: hypothetical protein EOO30_20075 [Comamonadaceae bacterium]